MNIVKRVKNANYTTISNVFLRDNKLSLKAKGLLAMVFALPEDWDFSINGLCAIIKEGKTSVYSAIDELKEKGYCFVEVTRNERGNITGNDYTFLEQPQSQSPHTENPHADNQPQINKDCNKTLNEKKNEIDESISKSSSSRTKYADDFEKAWEMAQRKGSKQEAYKYWKKLNEEEKKLVLAHLPFYYNSNERQYLKDFSGYLNRRYFTNVVCDRKGNVLYDPERQSSNTYRPLTDGAIRWSDKKNCYIYVNMYFGYIPDGYDDNERPDGATIMLNNSCEIIKWNAETKQWEKVE